MSNNNQQNVPALTPGQRIDVMLKKSSVLEKFTASLGSTAAGQLFATSILDLYNSDTNLQKCDPQKVVSVALTAAVLKLPINKQLGFAWIIPYDKKKKIDGKWQVAESIPTFQLGYKGLVQLAMRTGMYKHINAGSVYEGELQCYDKLSGSLDLNGKRTSDEIVGYFAYIETTNGFSKTMYSTVDDMEKHAQRYSPGYANDKYKKSAWSTNFPEMAAKTLLRLLIGKYGVMSIEMAGPMSTAMSLDDQAPEDRLREEIDNAAGEVIDLEPQVEPQEPVQEEGADKQQSAPTTATPDGPKF